MAIFKVILESMLLVLALVANLCCCIPTILKTPGPGCSKLTILLVIHKKTLPFFAKNNVSAKALGPVVLQFLYEFLTSSNFLLDKELSHQFWLKIV